MPRSKTGRKREKKVSHDMMEKAIKSVLNGQSKPRDAIQAFEIPKSTFFRQLSFCKKNNIEANEYKYAPNCDVKKILTEEEEEMLVNYVVTISQMHYGLTQKEFRRVAYKFAVARKKTVSSLWIEEEMAGTQWLRHFRKRHAKKLSLRKPEPTSLSRATSFNRTNVSQFFQHLMTAYDRYGPFLPQNIYNLDETGLTTVQVPDRILAVRGEKQVGKITSAERGQLVTAIVAINAVGLTVPPLLIFPRVKAKPFMLMDAPPGSVLSANPSGWTNDSIFMEYLQHFVSFTGASKDKKVLLILDGHESHKSMEAIAFARENGIVMVTLPPHTSHKLQPLDRTCFGPLKKNYYTELDIWHRNNPNQTFSIYNIAAALGRAWGPAFSYSNVTAGFKVTGIYPLNPNIFTDSDFLSSFVSDRPLPESFSAPGPSSAASCDAPAFITPAKSSEEAAKNRDTTPDVLNISPEDVCPFPKAQPRKKSNRGNVVFLFLFSSRRNT